jgi:putative aldouronate transport system permease protein
MKSRQIWLSMMILAILLISCFIFPFRTVSIGMDTVMTKTGYDMLRGFSFTADGAQITIPGQIFYIIAAIGALLLLACALWQIFKQGRGGGEPFAVIAAFLCMIGFLGQSLLEPGAYGANNKLPAVVRDLFNHSLEPAAVAANFISLLLFMMSLLCFIKFSTCGLKLANKLLAQKIKSSVIALAALALLLLATPVKTVDISRSERLVVYGFQLLSGTTISSGGTSVTIPPQPFLLGFAVLCVLTIVMALAKLPKTLKWLGTAFPVMAGLCFIGQLLFEMFIYNTDAALPFFARQLLSGKYATRIFIAVGAVFLIAFIQIISSIMVNNKKASVKFNHYSTLYLFMLPGLILFLLFNYLPMIGAIMSFQHFDPVSGFFKSEWVGLRNFIEIFRLQAFFRALRNTLTIAVLRIVIEFPCPIIFALLLNEIRAMKFKKTVQSISYLPNFISWVIVAGIWYQILSPSSGILNQALIVLGIIKEPVFFMQSKIWFFPIIIFTSIWKNLGFSSILYMASIAGIDQELYEAAEVDGAGRFRKMYYITLQGMKNTIVLLFILAISGLLNAGFDQFWTMGNAAVRDVSEILDTLVLRYLTQGSFKDLSLGAAAGMFKSVVGVVLFFAANLVSKKLKQESLI